MRASAAILLLASTLPETLAWGALAHRTVAYLATHSFKPETKVFVSTVLANEHGWDISDAALWPDKGVKRRRPETAQWHFIDAHDDPPTKCGVQFKRDCQHDGTPGCIVSALKNMSATIVDPRSSPTQLKEATMFAMHFLGDIHQPLHTEFLSRGGNDIPVCFESSCGRSHHVNLHSVWDSLIPNKWRNLSAASTSTIDEGVERAAAKLWASELYNATTENGVGSGQYKEEEQCVDVKTPIQCAVKWANESNSKLCSYVLVQGVDWLKENDLGFDYYAGAVPVVEDMVTKAGMRLGNWMNGLVAERMRQVGDLGVEGNQGGLVVQDRSSEWLEL